MSPIKIKFVSRKINKIRWQPKSTSVFVTGSYNDDDNQICVWKFPDPQSHMNDDVENDVDDDPQIISTKSFTGSVTDLKVASEELIFAASSLGSIFLFKYHDENLQCLHAWEKLHKFQNNTASATGIAIKSEDVASVGEDGKLCLLNFNINQKVREIASSDLCSFTCVTYLRHHEIVAGNSLGYLRLWDLRSPSEASSHLLTLSREQRGVSCMNTHPTQSHILATGYEDGSLCIWDMRQDRKPMSQLEGHSAAVTELLFHPTNPDFLYTSSLDSSVWQWDASSLRNPAFSFSTPMDTQETSFSKGNPWLNCDAHKHKLEITSLSGQTWTCVNSLDLSGTMLIWGTDNEELCILNDIAI
ncbi:Nucleoporin Nup43 like protein [Argiope bruennichi]|uniref:Nucleoporin Nup43 like protein n=1 Tax=Argiope bruennichi TaxID=94029 RepID=A0A8T0F230_ARGBR|nr:Nucleoporin Nup43 like protein [Argiope bruennichi]